MKMAAAIVVAMLASSVAFATAAYRLPLQTLTRSAEVIVDADTGAQESFRIDGRIFTRTTVKVRAIWKGAPLARMLREGAEMSIVTRGGIVDGIGQRVDGETVLTAGARSVLFLVYDDTFEAYRIVAMDQGSFVIADTQTTAPKGMRPTLPRLRIDELADFESRVRSYAR